MIAHDQLGKVKITSTRHSPQHQSTLHYRAEGEGCVGYGETPMEALAEWRVVRRTWDAGTWPIEPDRVWEIIESYEPYNSHPSCKPYFNEGMAAYGKRIYDNPYDAANSGVKAQAWDRGLEAAARISRLS
jgi:hypothetical protein